MQKILFKINANKNINYQIMLSFELVMTYQKNKKKRGGGGGGGEEEKIPRLMLSVCRF
jgi:hypothetical protein